MTFNNPQLDQIFSVFENKNEKSIDFMKNEFAVMRAGRANPKLVEKISVEYYGTKTPINQMGNISVPDSRTITITLWDKSALGLVEKAILSANIGITPQNDGTLIRLSFPQLTEERRRDLSKQVKKLAEDTKVAVRNNRRDAMESLKKIKAEKIISEDIIADCEKEVDKIVSKEIDNIDKLCKEKETDVMSV